MDDLKIEKLIAMKEYKKNQFMNKLITYFFIFLSCTLFCSSPRWIPFLTSSLRVFFLNMRALVFNPKCLFIVCNVIVVFLIGESKLASSKSLPPPDIYDEFVSRNGGVQQKKAKEMKLQPSSMLTKKLLCEKMVQQAREEEKKGEKDSYIYLEEEEEEEDLGGLLDEELRKRADDLIARVNRKMRMEAALY